MRTVGIFLAMLLLGSTGIAAKRNPTHQSMVREVKVEVEYGHAFNRFVIKDFGGTFIFVHLLRNEGRSKDRSIALGSKDAQWLFSEVALLKKGRSATVCSRSFIHLMHSDFVKKTNVKFSGCIDGKDEISKKLLKLANVLAST